MYRYDEKQINIDIKKTAVMLVVAVCILSLLIFGRHLLIAHIRAPLTREDIKTGSIKDVPEPEQIILQHSGEEGVLAGTTQANMQQINNDSFIHSKAYNNCYAFSKDKMAYGKVENGKHYLIVEDLKSKRIIYQESSPGPVKHISILKDYILFAAHGNKYDLIFMKHLESPAEEITPIELKGSGKIKSLITDGHHIYFSMQESIYSANLRGGGCRRVYLGRGPLNIVDFKDNNLLVDDGNVMMLVSLATRENNVLFQHANTQLSILRQDVNSFVYLSDQDGLRREIVLVDNEFEKKTGIKNVGAINLVNDTLYYAIGKDLFSSEQPDEPLFTSAMSISGIYYDGYRNLYITDIGGIHNVYTIPN